MARKKKSPRREKEITESMRVLAVNLDALMARTPDLESQPKLAVRSTVGQRTIGRILLMQVAAQIDTLDAIAGAFDLSAWELLAPTLTINPSVQEFNKRMRALLDRHRADDAK